MVLSNQLSVLPGLLSVDLRGSPVKFVSNDALPSTLETYLMDSTGSASIATNQLGSNQLGDICCDRGSPFAVDSEG